MTCSHFLCHLKTSACLLAPRGKMLLEVPTSPSTSLMCTRLTDWSPRMTANFSWICGTEARMKSEVIVTEAESGLVLWTEIASATAASTTESSKLAITDERS